MYGNFTFLATMKVHIGRSTGRSTPPTAPRKTAIELSGMAISHVLLLFKFILEDQLADLPPRKLPSSGEEWQFYMSFYYESSYWQIN